MDSTQQTKTSSKQALPLLWADSLWFRALLLTALALGVFFRFAGLGNKMYSHDEAYTSLYASGHRSGFAYTSLWDGTDRSLHEVRAFVIPSEEKSIQDTYFVLARFEPHESPMFFLLAHYWMRIVGWSPAAMRGLATLFSILSIPVLYWLCRELFNSPGSALLAMSLFALSPYQILFAQDARPYSLWVFVTLLSSAALIRAEREKDPVAWLLYSLTLILGIYSHQLFALVAISHALYFVSRQALRSPKILGGFLSAALLALLAFTPWLFHVITRWGQAATRMEWVNIQFPWYRYIQRWMLNFSSPLLDLEFKSGNIIPYGLRALLLLLVLFAWIYLLRYGSLRAKKFLLLLFIIPVGFFILPDVILGGIRSIGGRYFVPASIVTILVVAYFLSDGLNRADAHTGTRWKLLTISLAVAAIASNINSLYAQTWWNKELGRLRPEVIEAINRDNTLLILSGYHPTNLGDVLALTLELDSDVHVRLYEGPADIRDSSDYQNIYWLPASYNEVEQISTTQGFKVREIIPGVLWQFDGMVP